MGARPDDAHAAGQHIEELWQFIDAGGAQQPADPSDPIVVPAGRLAAVGIAAVGAQTQARIDAAGLALPLLVRPVATHGGEGLVRCGTCAELSAALAAQSGPFYVSAYCDTRDPDGSYRKYRMIFVDRKPYPYHLAISPHWMVHYYSAGMEGVRWKLDEEARFLADPSSALGARAMAAIAAVGERLDLDYAGVDFTVLPDGSVFVFEANATMLAHRERPGGELAHKNDYVQRIADAFEAMMAARAGAS